MGGLLWATLRFCLRRFYRRPKLGATLFIEFQVDTLRHAGDTRLVEDKKQVNPRYRLRGQFRRPYPNFSFVSVCPFQRHIEIVDAEEQEEPVARCRPLRAHQRRMLVRAPLVEAEQDSSIRIEDLTKVGMARRRCRLAEQRLVPLEAPRHVAHPDDRPRAFHGIPPGGLTLKLNGQRESTQPDRKEAR